MTAFPSYKTVFIGESGVGKTSIADYAHRQKFYVHRESTVGASFSVVKYPPDCPRITFHMWDTAGQERYHSLVRMYLRDAQIVIMVFDSTSPESLERIEKNWYPYVLREMPEQQQKMSIFVLVENKIDLPGSGCVTNRAKAFAVEHGLLYQQTSPANGIGVDDLLLTLTSKILNDKIESVSMRSYTELRAPSPHNYMDAPADDAPGCMGARRCNIM